MGRSLPVIVGVASGLLSAQATTANGCVWTKDSHCTSGNSWLQSPKMKLKSRAILEDEDMLQPLDGGVDRGCRGTNGDDYDASYYTVFDGVASLEECKAKCQEAPAEPVVCPVTGEGQDLGTISSRIPESSGLVASRKNPGLYWTHNDSGGRARIFAIDKHGNVKKTVWVKGARARDWEDIAAGPGPVNGESYVYIADIGDNRKHRGRVQIYRVTEPKLEESADLKIHATSDRFDVRYPDGAHDCEAMFIDQGPAAKAKGTSGRVYIITDRKSVV